MGGTLVFDSRRVDYRWWWCNCDNANKNVLRNKKRQLKSFNIKSARMERQWDANIFIPINLFEVLIKQIMIRSTLTPKSALFEIKKDAHLIPYKNSKFLKWRCIRYLLSVPRAGDPDHLLEHHSNFAWYKRVAKWSFDLK